MTFGGNLISCTTMVANLERAEASVNRIAPFRMERRVNTSHERVRRHTHWLAIVMGLSGKYNNVSIYMIKIFLEASYR